MEGAIKAGDDNQSALASLQLSVNQVLRILEKRPSDSIPTPPSPSPPLIRRPPPPASQFSPISGGQSSHAPPGFSNFPPGVSTPPHNAQVRPQNTTLFILAL